MGRTSFRAVTAEIFRCPVESARYHDRSSSAVARSVRPEHPRIPPRPALGGAAVPHHGGAEDHDRALPLALRDGAPAPAGIRAGHHRERSRAPRPGSRKPEPAGRVEDHAQPLRRPPDHHAGRSRPAAPSHPGGAPLHHRGERRVHHGRRRADVHAAGRLRDYAVVDVPRSRKPPDRWCGSTDSTCTW